jgi:hypothetical protein
VVAAEDGLAHLDRHALAGPRHDDLLRPQEDPRRPRNAPFGCQASDNGFGHAISDNAVELQGRANQPGNVDVDRIAVDRDGIGVLGDAPLPHHRDGIGAGEGLLRVVGHQYRRRPGPATSPIPPPRPRGGARHRAR